MDYEKKKLWECCKSISDGDHQPPPKVKNGIPFITITNIDGYNQLSFDDCMYVTEEYYDNLPDNKKAVDGDILYSVVGSFGKPVYVENLGKFVFQRHIAIIKPANGIDGRYLYYAMLNPDFFIQADRYAVGAAQRTLSLESLRSLEINLPDIKHQIKVADLLSKIDRKIKINNRINDNLPYQSTMMA